MFDLFDKFLDSLIDVYICNSAGICAILAAVVLSIIEGIITHFYFKKKSATCRDTKIYTLLAFRLVVFIVTVCFRWWLAFIVWCFAIIGFKQLEKRLYALKMHNMHGSQPDTAVNFDTQKMHTRLYLCVGLIYFCITLALNRIMHNDMPWLI